MLKSSINCSFQSLPVKSGGTKILSTKQRTAEMLSDTVDWLLIRNNSDPIRFFVFQKERSNQFSLFSKNPDPICFLVTSHSLTVSFLMKFFHAKCEWALKLSEFNILNENNLHSLEWRLWKKMSELWVTEMSSTQTIFCSKRLFLSSPYSVLSLILHHGFYRRFIYYS